MRRWLCGAALTGLLLGGCASGGPPPPDLCEIEVEGVEQWELRQAGLDVGYRVRGRAGSAGVTWLAAVTASGEYISGYGVDVGPGPFVAVIELELTGIPKEFIAVLEVAGRRCKAKAKKPSG